MEIIEFFGGVRIPITVVHVISVVVGMGGALTSDALFSFFSKDKHLNKTELSTLSFLSGLVFYSLIIISISGLAIFLSDIDKYLHSAKFLAKMSILALLIINGYFLNKYIWPHLLDRGFFTLKKERNIRRLAFVCGAVSVISWLFVCGLGVLDSVAMNYTKILTIYFSIIIIGVMIALLIEKKELN